MSYQGRMKFANLTRNERYRRRLLGEFDSPQNATFLVDLQGNLEINSGGLDNIGWDGITPSAGDPWAFISPTTDLGSPAGVVAPLYGERGQLCELTQFWCHAGGYVRIVAGKTKGTDEDFPVLHTTWSTIEMDYSGGTIVIDVANDLDVGNSSEGASSTVFTFQNSVINGGVKVWDQPADNTAEYDVRFIV